MYRPAHFETSDLAVLHGFIRARPLGLLVSVGTDGPDCDPVPFLLDAEAGARGVLKAHLARANPHWRLLQGNGLACVVFLDSGAYISPGWYPSKQQTGRVVPTWNYALVEARGTVRVHEEAEWLRDLVGRMTQRHEAEAGSGWRVEDAPDDFVAAQLRSIVGIEIEIETLTGKFKLSQNRPEADRKGVLEGLEGRASAANDIASGEMAALMRALKIGV